MRRACISVSDYKIWDYGNLNCNFCIGKQCKSYNKDCNVIRHFWLIKPMLIIPDNFMAIFIVKQGNKTIFWQPFLFNGNAIVLWLTPCTPITYFAQKPHDICIVGTCNLSCPGVVPWATTKLCTMKQPGTAGLQHDTSPPILAYVTSLTPVIHMASNFDIKLIYNFVIGWLCIERTIATGVRTDEDLGLNPEGLQCNDNPWNNGTNDCWMYDDIFCIKSFKFELKRDAPIYMYTRWELGYHMCLADGLAPDGARPSAVTVLTTKFDIFSFMFPWISMIL